MEKVYLMILVGGIMAANLILPFPLPSFILGLWTNLTFWGYLIVLMGVRSLQLFEKDKKLIIYFIFGVFATRLFMQLPIFVGFMPLVLLGVLYQFFRIGAFFWLFKAEYLFAPSSSKRVDLMAFSIVGALYLLLIAAATFNLIPFAMLGFIGQVFPVLNMMYYGILIYILVKLYLESRRIN